MGASGAGSTTLGKVLSQKLKCRYFDTDFFFWSQTEQPFTVSRNPNIRDILIEKQLTPYNDWIVGGCVIDWGEKWLDICDLVIFLYIPAKIRLQRLKNREYEVRGDQIKSDVKIRDSFYKFMKWAKGYDDNSAFSRTLNAHEEWLDKVSCPVLKIIGDTSIQERLNLILTYIQEIR